MNTLEERGGNDPATEASQSQEAKETHLPTGASQRATKTTRAANHQKTKTLKTKAHRSYDTRSLRVRAEHRRDALLSPGPYANPITTPAPSPPPARDNGRRKIVERRLLEHRLRGDTRPLSRREAAAMQRPPAEEFGRGAPDLSHRGAPLPSGALHASAELGGCVVFRRTMRLDGRGADYQEQQLLAQLPGPPMSSLIAFDIESTGLSTKRDLPVMIGALEWDPRTDALLLEQAVMQSPDQEHQILDWFAAKLQPRLLSGQSSTPTLLSYNGLRFDTPLLNNRYAENNLESPLTDAEHIDLLAHFKKHPPDGARRLKMTLMEEQLLNFYREGDPPGDEIARSMRAFVDGDKTALTAAILAHNSLDLLSLLLLFELRMRPTLGGRRAGAAAPAGGGPRPAQARTSGRARVPEGLPERAQVLEVPRVTGLGLQGDAADDEAGGECWTEPRRRIQLELIGAARAAGDERRVVSLLHEWVAAEPSYARPHSLLCEVYEGSDTELALVHARLAADLHPWDERLRRKVQELGG